MGEEERERPSTKEADLHGFKPLEKFDRPGIAELDFVYKNKVIWS